MNAALTAIESAKPLPDWIVKLQAKSRAYREGIQAAIAAAPKAPKPSKPDKPSGKPAKATPKPKAEPKTAKP